MFLQTGLEKNLFGNHPVSFHGTESRSPPPAFASDPLVQPYVGKDGASTATGSRPASLDIVEIEGPAPSLNNHEANFMKSTSPTGVRSSLVLYLVASCLLPCYMTYLYLTSGFSAYCCLAWCNHTKGFNPSWKAEFWGVILWWRWRWKQEEILAKRLVKVARCIFIRVPTFCSFNLSLHLNLLSSILNFVSVLYFHGADSYVFAEFMNFLWMELLHGW